MAEQTRKPLYQNGWPYAISAIVVFLGFCFIAPHFNDDVLMVRILLWGITVPLVLMLGFTYLYFNWIGDWLKRWTTQRRSLRAKEHR